MATSKNKTFFWNFVIFICSKVVKSYPRKKSCKNQTFHPILTIKYSIPTKMTMASSNMLSKLIFSHFLKFSFFDIKCWVRNVKNPFFSKSQKKLFQSICFTKTHFMNLFRMLFMFKAKTLPILRKVEKHLFSYKKTINFVAVFDKTQIFEIKNISRTYTTGIPKQFTFIHSSSIYPNFSTKIELLSHFYR